MNNNDYREITEDDVTTVSTDQKEEMNGQESVNDTGISLLNFLSMHFYK